MDLVSIDLEQKNRCYGQAEMYDLLERDEQLQQVRADLSSVPRPYDEDLGYVDEEGDEEDRPSNPVNMIKASESMHQHVKQRSYRAF